MAIQDILNNLLSEPLMRNMRQHMVDGLNQVYKDAIFEGDTNMEVVRSRDDFPALYDRLNAFDDKLTQTNSVLGTKASINYVDAVLMDIAKGGPQGPFYSINELHSTFPNGEEGTWLVFDGSFTDGAHSFIWDSISSVWKDLGTYQAKSLADNSVLGKHMGTQYLSGSIGNGVIKINTSDKSIKFPAGAYVFVNKTWYDTLDMTINWTSPDAIFIYFDTLNLTFSIHEGRIDVPERASLILLGIFFNGKVYASLDRKGFVVNGVPNGGWLVSNEDLSENYLMGGYAKETINIDTATRKITIPSGGLVFTNNYWYDVPPQTININNQATGIFIFLDLSSSLIVIHEGRSNVPKKPNYVLLGILFNNKIYNALMRGSFSVNGITDGGWKDVSKSQRDRYTFSKAYKDWLGGEKSPIVFLSDSTTDGDTTAGNTANVIGTDHINPNTYTSKLENLLRNETNNNVLRIYNAGFSGKQADWALQNINEIMDPYSDSKIVVIGYGINDRLTNLKDYYNQFYTRIENLIIWCINKSYQPALMTTQATLDIGLDTTSATSRSAETVNSIANQVKKELADKYNLELIDINKFTSMFLNYSAYSRSQIIPDRLHFGDIGHEYEAGLFFAEIVPRTHWITQNQNNLITLVDQKSRTDVLGSSKLSESTGKFKEVLNYIRTDNAEITLQDAWVFNATHKKLNVIGYGESDVYIDDTLYSTTDGQTPNIELELGLHHLVAKSTSTAIDWKGFEVIS